MARLRLAEVRDVLDESAWDVIKVNYNRVKSLPNVEKIATVAFQSATKTHAEKGIVNKVSVGIGRELIDELRWDINEKVEVLTHPDDIYTFKLVQGTRHGKRLNIPAKEAKSEWRQAYLVFTWSNANFKLQEMARKEVDFYVDRGQLILYRVG